MAKECCPHCGRESRGFGVFSLGDDWKMRMLLYCAFKDCGKFWRELAEEPVMANETEAWWKSASILELYKYVRASLGGETEIFDELLKRVRGITDEPEDFESLFATDEKAPCPYCTDFSVVRACVCGRGLE